MSARELYERDPEGFSAEVRAYADRMRPLAGNLAFGQAMRAYLDHSDKLEGLDDDGRREFDLALSYQIAQAKQGNVLSYSQAAERIRSYGLHEIDDEDAKVAHLAKQIQTATGKSYKDALNDAEREINHKSHGDSRQELRKYH